MAENKFIFGLNSIAKCMEFIANPGYFSFLLKFKNIQKSKRELFDIERPSGLDMLVS